MKKIISLFYLLGFMFLLNAQKYDNTWLWGADIYNQTNSYFGNGQGDFNDDTIKVYQHNRNMAFAETGGFFSNENGDLILYTNGMRINDTTGNVIENGDSINFGIWWSQAYQAMIQGYYGFYTRRGVIMFKKPGNDSSIIMIHEHPGDSGDNADSKIKVTEIRIKSTGGFKAITKNKIISQYAPSFQNIAACKHGNGKDWWILFTEVNTNCVVKLLCNSDTIIEYDRQCIGDTIATGWGVKATFSLDGTKYSSTDATKYGTNIFDFDRCSGLLSNPKHIPTIYGYDTLGNPNDFLNSIDFSPDNKLFYVFLGQSILQFDLESLQFPNDCDTITGFDTYIDTIQGHNTVPFVYWSSTYGPDGRLYIGNAGGQRFLCTIVNPNGKGSQCDFRMRNVVLPTYWLYTAPNIPNYRLGRLIGSACDTVYSDVKPIYTQTPWLKVFPNPATDEVQFDYNWVEWEKIEDLKLKIEDLSGRVVMEQQIPKYSTKQNLSVKQLAAGVYSVQLFGNGLSGNKVSIANCKLVKQ